MNELLSLAPKVALSRRGFVATGLVSGFSLAAAPVMAQSVITTDTKGLKAGEVKIPVAGGQMAAYAAMPDKGAPFPTVMVIQEIFGVHEHIKDVCRRLAKMGYLAIAPDLYARQADMSKVTEMAAAVAVAGRVPDAQVMGDLDATAAWAKKNSGDKSKLAITGFCWGGRITWLYAAHNPALTAGVAWYGRVVGQSNPLQPKHPVELAAAIKAPVLGLYGGADQGIPNDTVDQMRAALRTAGKTFDIVTYPDTPHAFNADYRATYRKTQAEDGWAKMHAWFVRHGAA